MNLKNPSPRDIALVKTLLFALCLLPLGWLVAGFCADVLRINPFGLPDEVLGANPIETVIRDLGDWALRFLLITLTVTPLRKLTGMHWLVRLRRMLGLFAFFYALLHFNIYLGLDQSYDWSEIAKDIFKRPFITIGMLTFVLLIPLAATSNQAALRAIGGKAWMRLHQLVYPLSVCAVLHYWWMVKLDTTQPAIYAGVLSILLMVRVRDYWRRLRQRY